MRSPGSLLAALMLLSAVNALLAQGARSPTGPRRLRLPDHATAVSPNIPIHPNPTTCQFETSITTHPTNPNIVLAAAIAGHTSGAVTSIGWYYTTDAGFTWVGADTLPTHTNLGIRVGDPAVGINRDGDLYINGVSGVSTFNVIVARSIDGGLHWTQTGVPPENSHKNHLTIDVNPGSPFVDSIYVSYAIPGGGSAIRFARSANRGQSFSAPVTVNGSVGSPGTNAPNLAVAANGNLYATWIGTGSPRPLGFNKSTDGGLSWGTASLIRQINSIGTVKEIDFGGSLPSMAVDRSSGSRRGWIYIVYPQRNPSRPDIFLIRSSDGGNSWGNPLKVNQDTSGNDQWLPWISVDPATGNLFVVYFDSRNFALNDSAEVYISASTDGGETFRDILVSDVPFRPSVLPVFPYYGGAYIGIAALRDTVWPCWYDNRTGISQVYTARVVLSPTSVRELSAEIPAAFALDQNYPNPFNPSTAIRFSLPQPGYVTLQIFNTLGEVVDSPMGESLPAGTYEVKWDASDLPSGAYFCALSSGTRRVVRRMLLLR